MSLLSKSSTGKLNSRDEQRREQLVGEFTHVNEQLRLLKLKAQALQAELAATKGREKSCVGKPSPKKPSPPPPLRSSKPRSTERSVDDDEFLMLGGISD